MSEEVTITRISPTRIIRVESCDGCPNYDWRWPETEWRAECQLGGKLTGWRKRGNPATTTIPIPKWCPLESVVLP